MPLLTTFLIYIKEVLLTNEMYESFSSRCWYTNLNSHVEHVTNLQQKRSKMKEIKK